MAQPDVWLRGAIPGIHESLQPIAHALLQAEEDVLAIIERLTHEEIWSQPGESAPIGFHIFHLAGSLDRLFTYARNDTLSDRQRIALTNEKTVADDKPTVDELTTLIKDTIKAAVEQLEGTNGDALYERREVGRARLPSNVFGLLVHGAEHSARHAGQVSTLARVLSRSQETKNAPLKFTR